MPDSISINIANPPLQNVRVTFDFAQGVSDSPLVDPFLKTSPFTPSNRGVYQIDLTAGGFQIDAPDLLPSQWFTIIDVTPNRTANLLTISFVATLLNGVADTYIMADGTTGSAVTFIRVGGPQGYAILSKSVI